MSDPITANHAPVHHAEYEMCDNCHRAYRYHPTVPHECLVDSPVIQNAEHVNILGFHGQHMPSICVPFGRLCRILYWYTSVPLCAIFSLIAMALYGKQMFDISGFNSLPGLLCGIWFIIFTCICWLQFAYWSVTFLPARYSKTYYTHVSKTFFGKILQRDAFYVAINHCQYAMLCTVAVEALFLVVAQHALIDYELLNQNFGWLMGIPCLIHMIVLIVRLLSWSQETFNDTFYVPWWDIIHVAPKKKPYYEWDQSASFQFMSLAYGQADLMMGVFAIAVTYGLTEYNSKTDKVYQFFQTWHPCVLIDHYPASLVGMFLIGIREVVGLAFNCMLMVFMYCRAGPVEVAWSFATIAVSQLLCVIIVNAFSAQLYTEADYATTVENFKMTQSDLLNVRAHTLSYCTWLAGMIILFGFQFRMMYRFNIPFGNGSLLVKIAWHIFFVVGMIFTITMTAAMVIAITYLSMDWTHNPSSFLQTIIGFMFNTLQGKYLMLMVAPVQRRLFPEDLSILFRVTANPARGKFGVLGRSESVLACTFWVLGFLIFGTYLIDDTVDSSITLFPLARGFRIKPAVFVFAPAWFLCCMMLAYAVFLKVQEAAAMGTSPLRLLAIKVTGLVMVLAGLMCLFMTIPLWVDADMVTIALVVMFPLWFFVTQGFNIRSVLYVSSYTILTVLSAVKRLEVQMNVICSVLLLIQMMFYPCFFKRPNVRLFWHFEVLNQKRVKDHRQQPDKHYELAPIESQGAYAQREDDYAGAAKVADAAAPAPVADAATAEAST